VTNKLDIQQELEGLETEATKRRAHIEWLKKQIEYNERSLQYTERKIAFWKQEIQKEEEED
jgi:hypothetical protein